MAYDNSLANAVWLVVHWFVVPLIILLVFLYTLSLLRSTREGEQRTSARAGFWAGLVLLLIFIVARLDDVSTKTFTNTYKVTPSIVGMVIATGVGFTFFRIVRAFLPTRLIGLMICFLTAFTSIALYSYFFISSAKTLVLTTVLGMTLGSLLHIVLDARTLKSVLPETHGPDSLD
jgi:hypothetical protein